MIAHWYDVLDVDPGASEAEIRAAWRAAIADLTPADRRFRLYNQAAEVLLDPERRAEHDAELAQQDAEPHEEPHEEPVAPAEELVVVVDPTAPATATDSRREVPTWALAVLAVVTALMVALTAYLFTEPTEEAVEGATGSARAAAERAVVPVLSYDHRTLDEDQQEAEDLLTADYRGDYADLFEVIRKNAGPLETVVEVEVIASAVVRAGEDRAEILLFVNRPTTNAETKEPVVYKDQVTLTMARVDGDWLVDDLKTSPVQQ